MALYALKSLLEKAEGSVGGKRSQSTVSEAQGTVMGEGVCNGTHVSEALPTILSATAVANIGTFSFRSLALPSTYFRNS